MALASSSFGQPQQGSPLRQGFATPQQQQAHALALAQAQARAQAQTQQAQAQPRQTQAAPGAAAPGPVVKNLFAAVVPGRMMINAFQQVTAKNFIYDLPAPALVREFSLSLLQPQIPATHGIGIFYALPPYKEWQYVGKLTLQTPSDFFRAPWYGKIPDNTPAVRIGVSVETLDTLKQQATSDAKEEEREMHSAQGIAKDLFNYMSSFSQTTGQFAHLGDVLVIPTTCIDTWFKKFLTKHKRSPFFWMKKSVAQEQPK